MVEELPNKYKVLGSILSASDNNKLPVNNNNKKS